MRKNRERESKRERENNWDVGKARKKDREKNKYIYKL